MKQREGYSTVSLTIDRSSQPRTNSWELAKAQLVSSDTDGRSAIINRSRVRHEIAVAPTFHTCCAKHGDHFQTKILAWTLKSAWQQNMINCCAKSPRVSGAKSNVVTRSVRARADIRFTLLPNHVWLASASIVFHSSAAKLYFPRRHIFLQVRER